MPIVSIRQMMPMNVLGLDVLFLLLLLEINLAGQKAFIPDR